MKPGDPISKSKIGVFHALFAEIGGSAEDAVRDEIEEITGSRSTTSLNEALAWELLYGMFGRLGRSTPFPIVAAWCPVYQRQPAKLGAGNTATLPSQKQVWHLFHLLHEAGVNDPRGGSSKRFRLKDGLIRTAQEAGRVIATLRNMRGAAEANRTIERAGAPPDKTSQGRRWPRANRS